MKTVRVPIPPTYYAGYEDCDLSEWDLEHIKGAEWIVYYYGTGSWEGGGEAIVKSGEGKICHYSLGHCSCYGPLDGRGHLIEADSVGELMGRSSDDLKRDLAPILEAIEHEKLS